jgi:hypothetical protein
MILTRTGATVYAVQHKDLVGAKRGTVETSVFFQGVQSSFSDLMFAERFLV